MIEQKQIYYIKSSIRDFNNTKDRVRINMDIIGKDTKIHKLVWMLSRQKRELNYELEKRELYDQVTSDRDYEHYQTALKYWETARKQFGNNIVLWIGKLHIRNRYIPGKIQHYSRLRNAVSTLMQLKAGGDIFHNVWCDDFHYDTVFDYYPNQQYAHTWEWKNKFDSESDAIDYTL